MNRYNILKVRDALIELPDHKFDTQHYFNPCYQHRPGIALTDPATTMCVGGLTLALFRPDGYDGVAGCEVERILDLDHDTTCQIVGDTSRTRQQAINMMTKLAETGEVDWDAPTYEPNPAPWGWRVKDEFWGDKPVSSLAEVKLTMDGRISIGPTGSSAFRWFSPDKARQLALDILDAIEPMPAPNPVNGQRVRHTLTNRTGQMHMNVADVAFVGWDNEPPSSVAYGELVRI